MLAWRIDMGTDGMMTMTSRLTDEALTAELTRLVASERGTTAAMIVHLAEFAARGLHLAAGFPSLFAYCTEALHLSEHEAYNRIEAARLAVRFPEVLVLVKEGALNLTTVRLLAPHLTEENKESLLAEASYKSKREAEEVIVRYAPRSEVRASVRRIPAAETTPEAACRATDKATAATTPGLSGADISPAALSASMTSDANATAPMPAAPPARPAWVRPLAVDRYAIRFTATAETRDKLRLATDLLRHAVPDGDMAQVVDRALSALLEELARQKFAVVRDRRDRRTPGTQAPEPDRRRSDGRHIPAAVKRAVWLRDGDRCAFVGQAGRRCNERGRLEFHHVRPYAVGGAATVENIQIRCRAHNALEAELFFGPTDGYADATGQPNSFRNEFASLGSGRSVMGKTRAACT